MSWFGDLLKRASTTAPTDWTFLRDLADPGSDVADKAFVTDEHYVEVWIESARLEAGRRWFSRFSATVYSSVTLATEGAESAHALGMHTPSEELQKDDRDRVLLVSKRVLPAVPWRGGVLDLELGLFSVNHGDLITPVLKYVTSVASKAGISVAVAVDPFVPLVTEGLGIIAGQTSETQVEIGLDTSLPLTKSGYYAVVAAPRTDIGDRSLVIDPDDMRLEFPDGERLAAGYCVFSIRRVEQNSEWASIPDLKKSWASIATAVVEREQARAYDALDNFRSVLAFDPNLVQKDKDALLRKAKERVDGAFAPSPNWAPQQQPDLEPLDSLDLYSAEA
ncbi:hypothetical protein ASF48_08560 [Rathayibacter sp. Leaf299]|uniref:hypothetical protein n=1 Tax=Rathayibacter sp. Leaf299 TaxID=1736328 RepID=UPI0006F3CBA4|nr:hypothetical protein [Rathayibacter sp. Leaf299]KQQ20657.1 hypothetical protein ASF48_08560 [Rathayibacter sp. Leaf299]